MAFVADIVALDDVNEKVGPDEPKPIEEAPVTVGLSPNENTVDGEEPNRGLDIEDDGPGELLPNKPEVTAGEKVLPDGLEELALAEKEKPGFEELELVGKEKPGVEFDALETEKNAELVLDTPVPEGKENPELEPEGFAISFVVPNDTCPIPGEDDLFNPNAEDDDVPNTEEELLNPNVADEEKEPG